MSTLFTGLEREHWLAGLGEQSFLERAAYYVYEINAVHPFREGNGRAILGFDGDRVRRELSQVMDEDRHLRECCSTLPNLACFLDIEFIAHAAPHQNMACKNGIIESNPVSKVKSLREPEPRGRYLNQYGQDEEERLMNSLAVYGEYMVALASLDLETGMRLGELLVARWEDVNMLAREIFVRFTRNGKSRTLPLTKRAVRLLTDLRQDARPEDLIFDPERTGRRRRQTMVVFEQAVGEAGLDDLTFHDLRRTFATRLRAAGVHEYDIADLLGHSTKPGDTRASSVTRGNAMAVPQRLRVAVELLEVGRRLAACPPTAHQVASPARRQKGADTRPPL